jgi:hypothetical protein
MLDRFKFNEEDIPLQPIEYTDEDRDYQLMYSGYWQTNGGTMLKALFLPEGVNDLYAGVNIFALFRMGHAENQNLVGIRSLLDFKITGKSTSYLDTFIDSYIKDRKLLLWKKPSTFAKLLEKREAIIGNHNIALTFIAQTHLLEKKVS